MLHRRAVLLLALAASGCFSTDPDSAAPAGEGGGGKADDVDNPHSVSVGSVWKEASGTAGKQFMAILQEDPYTHGEQFLIYGKKSGKLNVRSFVAPFFIFEFPGSTEQAEDNFYKLSATFVTKDHVEITLVGLDGRQHDLAYDRLKTDPPTAGAIAAADKFYAKYDQLLDHPIATLADLKGIVALHQRTHDYYPNEQAALPWQFVLDWLEIEASTELTAPDSTLAGVEILADGSDPISKLFAAQFGQPWTAPADVPTAEEALEGFDSESGEPSPVFYTFEAGIHGVEPGMLRDGLDQLALFTVTELIPYECEDFYDFDHGYYWVLADGSILSHDPFNECD